MSTDTAEIPVEVAMHLALRGTARTAATRVMGEHHPELPALSWSPDVGSGEYGQALTGYADVLPDDVPEALSRWVDMFGLQPAARVAAGSVEYAGCIGGLRVTVWGVVDREAWETVVGAGR